jgi:hypothetical protein
VNKIWQGVADLASELLEDQSRDRAAMRIPFKGSFDQPKADVWSAIGSLVRNAFVQALRRGFEGSVGIEKVSGMDPGKDAEKKRTRARTSPSNAGAAMIGASADAGHTHS